MTRSSRALVRFLAGGLALLVLTACGDTPVRAGAAATVGDSRITTTQLSDLVDRALADPQALQQLGTDKVVFQRQALSRLINHDLLAEAGRREGVRITPGQVDSRLAEFEQQAGGPQMLVQQAAANGIAEPDLKPFISDLVLSDVLGDSLTADVPVPKEQLAAAYEQSAARNDQVHAAHILVPTQKQAESILEQVKADPGAFADLAATFSTDTSNKDKGGDLGFAGRGQFVPAFEKAIFAAKPGEVVLVKTEFGFHVVKILERKTTTLAQATPALRRAILQQEREQQLAEALSAVANDLGVKVNPRFGRWNPATGSVEEIPIDGSSVSSPAPVTTGEDLVPDLGTPQQGQPDQGQPDQGQPDQGQPDQGQPDQGQPDQGQPPAPQAP